MLKSTPLHGRIAALKASDNFTTKKGRISALFFVSTFDCMWNLPMP
jgi:hypothetical protein